MPSVDGPLLCHRFVLLIALVVSHSGVSAGQWYGGYGPVQPSSQDRGAASAGKYGGAGWGRGDYYQDRQSVFIDSSGNTVHGVPSTQGYRFREIETTPVPESKLPKFRPSTFGGKSPYAWGAPSGQWPESYSRPAPVFRPLEPQERGKSHNQDLRNRYERFGYQGLPPRDQADHGTGGSDYYPESHWAPQW